MTDETFNCPIKFSQQGALSNFVGTLDAKGVPVPQDVRNLAGRINKYAAEAQPSGGGAIVDGNGPLGRFDAAPSDWAAWRFITDAERTALKQRYPGQDVTIDNFVQFYAGGSAGGMGVNGRIEADGSYAFWKLTPSGEVLTPDVGGAADAYVKQLCIDQGRTYIGHLR